MASNDFHCPLDPLGGLSLGRPPVIHHPHHEGELLRLLDRNLLEDSVRKFGHNLPSWELVYIPSQGTFPLRVNFDPSTKSGFTEIHITQLSSMDVNFWDESYVPI